jgi:hypothetical protein
MATTNFQSGTVIASTWLNDVNGVTYNKTFPDGTIALSTAPGSLLDATAVSYEEGTLASGAVARTVAVKLQETVSVKDFGVTGSGTETTAFQAALTALAGSSGNGYQTNPVTLNLNGLTITFTGQIFLPINVSLINGTLTSNSGSVVMRNPYIANTGGPGYTAYWPYMTAVHNQVAFNCLTILNVYINANFYNCSFPVGLVLVNSNSLWTEHNRFIACTFSGNSTNGFGILMDGNLSNTSIYSTGSGAGTSDGSFGYNSFEADCEVSVSDSIVGLKLTDGATFYNGNIYFNGYTNGVSPSGSLIYLANTANVCTLSYCNFDIHVESSDSGSNYANIISLDGSSKFWYNTGFIHSASAQTTFSQSGSVDMRGNNIYVIGTQLTTPGGTAIYNGATYPSIINGRSLLARAYAKPAFSGTLSTPQSFSSNVVTKMVFDSSEYDTNSNYSASRFTPTVAGYYQINSNVAFTTSSSVTSSYIAIYKNGSVYKIGTGTRTIQNPNPGVSSLVYLNGTTDYVEIYGYVFDNGQAPATVAGGQNTFFNGSFVTTGGL